MVSDHQFRTTVDGQPLLARQQGRDWTLTWKDETWHGRSLLHLIEQALGPSNHRALQSAVDALLEQMDTDAPVARDDSSERPASSLRQPTRPNSSDGHSSSTESVAEVRLVGGRARRWARGFVAPRPSTRLLDDAETEA